MRDVGVLEQLERIAADLKREGRITSDSDWCTKAGVSRSYLGTLKTRLRKDPSVRPRFEEARKLMNWAGYPVAVLLGEPRWNDEGLKWGDPELRWSSHGSSFGHSFGHSFDEEDPALDRPPVVAMATQLIRKRFPSIPEGVLQAGIRAFEKRRYAPPGPDREELLEHLLKDIEDAWNLDKGISELEERVLGDTEAVDAEPDV